MSLSFSIVHQKETRKVTCERSASVAQLLNSSLQKFKLPAGTSGTLFYGGKKLDPSSPLRFTNLVNNGKLTLEITSAQEHLNLKVISGGRMSLTQILKIRSATLLPDLVLDFCTKAGVGVPDAKVSVSVLHNSVDSLQPRFCETTVGSMVGNVPSAVLRLNFEEKRELKKQESVAPKETSLPEKLSLQKRPEVTEESPDEHPVRELKKSESVAENNLQEKGKIEELSLDGNNARNNEVTEYEEVTEKEAENEDTESEAENERSENQQSLSIEPADTLYIPQAGTQGYENPDEDYELTSLQAEKYYKILKSMQGRPGPKKTASLPLQYTIRLRFPDRALLDLHFPDPEVKLGQLFKKIDSYVNERYINAYKLKSSSPPFKEILANFASNNMPLHTMPEFLQERVMLIWEPALCAGQYLKEGIATKAVSELPTVQLESMRGTLADEPAPKKKGVKGMPKWFKTGK